MYSRYGEANNNFVRETEDSIRSRCTWEVITSGLTKIHVRGFD
jgi:hypothetical protein